MGFSDFPLKDCIIIALAQRNQRRTQNYRSPLWELCWYTRAHPELANLSATAALRKVERVLLNDLGRGFSWRSEFGIADAEAHVEFCHLWGAIVRPYGTTTVEQAIERAKLKPLHVPDSPPLLTVLVSAAYYLARGIESDTLFLPCTLLAKHLGCSSMTVSRLRAMATERDYITMVEPHSFAPGRKSKSTVFRVNIGRLSSLEKRGNSEGQNSDSLIGEFST